MNAAIIDLRTLTIAVYIPDHGSVPWSTSSDKYIVPGLSACHSDFAMPDVE